MEKKTAVEVAGVVGVIASLLFVGVQVRQSAQATRAATVLQLKENWLQLNLMQIENPEVIHAAFQQVKTVGYANADSVSVLVVQATNRVLMHNWSNSYYQYRLGTLDDEQWRPLLRDMEADSRRPVTAEILWQVWDELGYIYDDPFRSLMDSLKAANFDASR